MTETNSVGPSGSVSAQKPRKGLIKSWILEGHGFSRAVNAPKPTRLQPLRESPKLDQSSPKHYPALDGLRGVAILAVMLFHLSGRYHGTNVYLRLWGVAASAGWMGVDLFFVLSGFLITGILYDTAHSKKKARNFYARRTLRIFPLFYGVLLLLLLATPLIHLHWERGYLLYFFYMSNMVYVIPANLHPIGHRISLDHFWSLAVEEQFYLVWPWIVWWVKDRKKLLLIAICGICVAPVLRAVLLKYGVRDKAVETLLITRSDSFLFGAAVALAVRGPHAVKLPAGRVLLFSLAVLSVVIGTERATTSNNPMMLVLGYSSIALASAALVYMAWEGKSAIARLLDNKGLRFFGKYSYGLYVFHGLFFIELRHLADPLQGVFHSLLLAQIVMFVFTLALSISLAILSFRYIEAPFLNLKRYFS